MSFTSNSSWTTPNCYTQFVFNYVEADWNKLFRLNTHIKKLDATSSKQPIMRQTINKTNNWNCFRLFSIIIPSGMSSTNYLLSEINYIAHLNSLYSFLSLSVFFRRSSSISSYLATFSRYYKHQRKFINWTSPRHEYLTIVQLTNLIIHVTDTLTLERTVGSIKGKLTSNANDRTSSTLVQADAHFSPAPIRKHRNCFSGCNDCFHVFTQTDLPASTLYYPW
jgi:hypothetical protein